MKKKSEKLEKSKTAAEFWEGIKVFRKGRKRTKGGIKKKNS